jgi:hypothetical protein
MVTLTDDSRVTSSVAFLCTIVAYLPSESDCRRLVNTRDLPAFVAWFTFAGNWIALFLAAGERLEFGRRFPQQPSCDLQCFREIRRIEPIELSHRFIRIVFPDTGCVDIES